MVKISVIIPVYNTKKSVLMRCLDSIECPQNCKVECVIVFDGQPEFDVAFLQDAYVDTDIRYIIAEHGGVSHARNVGLDHASGEYVVFIDVDDVLPKEGLSNLFDVIDNAELVVGSFLKVQGRQESLIRPSIDAAISTPAGVLEYQLGVLLPDTGNGLLWNKMYSMQCINEHAIRFNESISVGEDSDFVYRYLIHVHTIRVTSKPVYTYIRMSNTAVTAFRASYEQRIFRSMEIMRENVTRQQLRDWSYFSTYYTYHILLIIVHYIFNPNNQWSVAKEKEEYEVLWRIAVNEINNCKKKEFNIAKRITIFCFRHRFFVLNKMIAWIRDRQIG